MSMSRRDSTRSLRPSKAHQKQHKRTTSDWSRILSSIFETNNNNNSNKKVQNEHVVDAEALTREERLSRLLHTPKPVVQIPKTGPLFEYFLVIGLSNCTDDQPRIIFHYPPDKEVKLPGIEDFCFPDGVKMDVIKDSPCQSSIIDLTHNQSYLKKLEDSYVFLLTDENKVVYYGMCVQKQELLEDFPSFVQEFEVPNDFHASTKRCYCLISKFPFFRLHLEFVYNIFSIDHLIRLERKAPSMYTEDEREIFYSGSKFEEPGSPELLKRRTSSSISNPKHKIQRRGVSKSDSNLTDIEKKDFDDYSSNILSSPEILSPPNSPPTNSPPLSPPRKLTSPSPLRKNITNSFENLSPIMSLVNSHSGSQMSDLSKTESTENDYFSDISEESNNDNTNESLNPPIATKNDIIEAMERFRSLDIPKQGHALHFDISDHLSSLTFRRPFFDEEEEIFSDWGLPLTFYNFSFQNICTILSAILLERKVAFYSTNLRYLSSFVLSFPPLIRPFVYQSVIITTLPQKMYSFLDAPVPFVVGITTLPDDLPSDVVLVDVAKKTIKSSEPLPTLPKFNELKKKSVSYLNQLKKTFVDSSPPFNTSKEQAFLVESISTIFGNHFSGLFNNFHNYTIRDLTDPAKPITVFMKESFLYDMSDSSFFSPFLSSQIFFDYSDKRLRKRDDKEGK